LADLADGLLPFLDLLLRVGEEVVGMAVIVGECVVNSVGEMVGYIVALPDFEFVLEDFPIVGDIVGMYVVGPGVIVGLNVGDAVVVGSGEIVGE